MKNQMSKLAKLLNKEKVTKTMLKNRVPQMQPAGRERQINRSICMRTCFYGQYWLKGFQGIQFDDYDMNKKKTKNHSKENSNYFQIKDNDNEEYEYDDQQDDAQYIDAVREDIESSSGDSPSYYYQENIKNLTFSPMIRASQQIQKNIKKASLSHQKKYNRIQVQVRVQVLLFISRFPQQRGQWQINDQYQEIQRNYQGQLDKKKMKNSKNLNNSSAFNIKSAFNTSANKIGLPLTPTTTTTAKTQTNQPQMSKNQKKKLKKKQKKEKELEKINNQSLEFQGKNQQTTTTTRTTTTTTTSTTTTTTKTNIAKVAKQKQIRQKKSHKKIDEDKYLYSSSNDEYDYQKDVNKQPQNNHINDDDDDDDDDQETTDCDSELKQFKKKIRICTRKNRVIINLQSLNLYLAQGQKDMSIFINVMGTISKKIIIKKQSNIFSYILIQKAQQI